MQDPKTVAHTMAVDCYCFRARRVSRGLTRLYDEALRPLGVQTSQLSLLVVVAMAPDDGAPLGMMADVLLMDRTTLSRNLRPLEKAGLLRVARSPADKRAKLVLLTPAGQRVVTKSLPLWRAAQRKIAAAMGSGPAAQLRTQLDTVIGALNSITQPAAKRSGPAATREE